MRRVEVFAAFSHTVIAVACPCLSCACLGACLTRCCPLRPSLLVQVHRIVPPHPVLREPEPRH